MTVMEPLALPERGRVAMILWDKAALNIAEQYRFKPAMRGGIAVPACVRYQLNFRLTI